MYRPLKRLGYCPECHRGINDHHIGCPHSPDPKPLNICMECDSELESGTYAVDFGYGYVCEDCYGTIFENEFDFRLLEEME